MRHVVKSFVLSVFIISLLVSCKNENNSLDTNVRIVEEVESKVPVYDFEAFAHILEQEDDKIYVVNFWATWCKPCIKELPEFEAIVENYGNQGVEVILVSLDFSEKLKSHVIPFIEEHNLQSKVVLLDDTDSNTWIPKVAEQWSGAIPATIIYSKDSRKFYERTFTYNELETELKTFLQ